MEKTIEQKVAETVLQRTTEVLIGGKTFHISPPSTATLIRVSELVSLMPGIKLDPKNIVVESLRVAKDCKVLGEITAVMVLGEGLPHRVQKIKDKGLRGFLGGTTEEVVDPYKELAHEVLHSLTAKQLNALIIQLLKQMEIADFFGLTTSLIEVNLLQATREVEMTASGPQ